MAKFIKRKGEKSMTKRELMILINAHSVARIVEDVVAPIDGFGNTMPDKGIESDIMYLYQVINAHTIKSVKGKSDSEFEVWRDNLLLYSNDVSTEDVVNALYDPENTEPFTEEELEMIKNAYKGLKPLREAARKLTGSERLAPEI